MTSKLQKKNQAGVAQLANNAALGSSLAAMWRTHQDGHALQGTSDGLREVQDAWGRQHWPTHVRGVGAHPEGPDDAWTTHGGDGQDARDGAGSDDWLRWPPKTGQVAKRESQLGMAVWPKVRHGKYTEEAQS
jgi:hypothetical protein